MTIVAVILSLIVLGLAVAATIVLRRRAAHLWWAGYVRHRRQVRTLPPSSSPIHVLVCLADHFEPGNGNVSLDVQRQRVDEYVSRLGDTVSQFRDADGRAPVQTFFYPVEQYHPDLFDALRPLVERQLVEMEVHLHHDRDTAENLRLTLERAKNLYARHGYLCRTRDDSSVRFAFIHGNWALDNSLPDGRWCGVNDELQVLSRCGCYADFTFPSAPSLSQPRTVNSIYYATDDPARPRSADFGTAVRVGGKETGDLLIVQGPLAPNWRRRKFGLLPRLENAELSAANPATPERVGLWVRQHVHVVGRPEWVFVKLHTHGATEGSREALLGEPRRQLHRIFESRYNDGSRYMLHYVSARELVNIVLAARDGLTGDPNEYRNYSFVPLQSELIRQPQR